ncbi:DUF5977 domain-containing protein [Xanthocytophaga agilis]|uniref:DUF5977 domain-containing protein n=1 Tax=Xanthocytophaga agilis TaxID=3048010 RepID=A0AAE3QYX0_9BACT|nr:DUF5977 domain-containing protein [Xanthocytophaga agilis]MDJ1500666.1 DUF5977 domain-containing protein [Xanthocytophaga agilis]
MITLTKEPQYLSAAFNKVEFGFTDTGYTVGDLYFCDIYQLSGKDLKQSSNQVSLTGSSYIDTLIKNGSGDGKVSFDVSLILQSMLDNPEIPITSGHSNNYIGYFIKAGTVSYTSGNTQIKTIQYQSKAKFATRSALPMEDYNFGLWHVNYVNGNRKFLSNSPDTIEMADDEEFILSVIIPKNNLSASTINLKADIYRITGFTQTNITVKTYQIATGGTYEFRIKPSTLFTGSTDIDRFAVWLDTADPIVYGCTLPNAPNYNDVATIDDGTCQMPDIDFQVAYSGYTIISGSVIERKFVISDLIGGEEGFGYEFSTNGINYIPIQSTGKTFSYYSGGSITFYIKRNQTVVSKTVQSPYFSAYAQSGFTRNDCTSGYTGTSINYTVPFAKYNSLISQQAANQLALAEIATSGQTTANLSGTCVSTIGTIRASIRYANISITFPDQYGGTYSTADVWLDVTMYGTAYNPGGTITFNLEEINDGASYSFTETPTIASSLLAAAYVLEDSRYDSNGNEWYRHTNNYIIKPGTGYII